jgi:hypothetical protein
MNSNMSLSLSCVAGCLDAEAPVRFSFLSLYQWPDSDAEFVRILGMKEDHRLIKKPMRAYNESIYACRQMYLRSYTFSKKETVAEKTKKCYERAKRKIKILRPKRIMSLLRKLRARSLEAFYAFLSAVFHWLLACTTSVDVKQQQ